MESDLHGKNRAITETGEIPSMAESVRNSPGYKSSISYTTVWNRINKKESKEWLFQSTCLIYTSYQDCSGIQIN